MVVRLVIRSALMPSSMLLTGSAGGTALTFQVSAGSRSVVSTAACMLPCLGTWMSIQYVPSAQESMPKSPGEARLSITVSPLLAKLIGLLTLPVGV